MKPAERRSSIKRGVRVERLDHLEIAAGVCREIALADYLATLAEPRQQHVSVGTATVAMLLNGLGFSNRRLNLLSQFFATKPVAQDTTHAWHPCAANQAASLPSWGSTFGTHFFLPVQDDFPITDTAV
jgi:hypothetical protein